MNIAQAQGDYIAKVAQERGDRAATQARYMLAKLGLHGTTGRDLDNARTRLRGELSASSVNRIMAEARGFLQWARKTERLMVDKHSITDCLEWYPVEHRKLTLPSQEQIRTLLQTVLGYKRHRKAHVRLVTLCLFAGLRPGEAETLEHGDVTRNYLHLKRTKTQRERHAYFTHSRVLPYWLVRRDEAQPLMPTKARGWLLDALERCGWGSDGRNVLRKLCVTYCACSGTFSEYQMTQQFGHSRIVSMEHYRDRQVLDCIKPGDCIEDWMGVADLVPALREAATDRPPRNSNAGSHDATQSSQPGHQESCQATQTTGDTPQTCDRTDSQLATHGEAVEPTQSVPDQPPPPEQPQATSPQ